MEDAKLRLPLNEIWWTFQNVHSVRVILLLKIVSRCQCQKFCWFLQKVKYPKCSGSHPLDCLFETFVTEGTFSATYFSKILYNITRMFSIANILEMFYKFYSKFI